MRSHTSGHSLSAAAAADRGAWGAVKAYVGLTKPRIVELLLVTTLPAMFLAAGGFPPLGVALWTLIGGTLSAASANVFNSVLDADIDEQMRRTRRRPMVRALVTRRAAYTFGAALGVVSTVTLGLGANWFAAGLSVVAIAYYVLVYTLLLKRRTPQNIVWGGVAGCFPPLIGWVATTGSLAWTPLVLFAIVFFWTPPHTWALALRYRADYAGVDVPMLPVVKDSTHVTTQMLVYSVLTVAASLVLWPVAPTGWLYPLVATLSGAWLLVEGVALLRRARAGMTDAALRPLRLFHWSNSYLAIVFIAAAVDAVLS